MSGNGIVVENAVHNINKEKFNEGYDRIFNADCYICGVRDKKSNLKEVDFEGDHSAYVHEGCDNE